MLKTIKNIYKALEIAKDYYNLKNTLKILTKIVIN